MKKVSEGLIKEVLQEARESSRKRAMHNLHEPDDTLQRMVNAGLADTYIPPHKHEDPDKLEIFIILKGKVGVIVFDDNGDVKEAIVLGEENKIFEVPARTWHCFVVLSEEAVLFEIIEGKYDAKTHKKFASWAPEENSEGAREYLEKLKNKFS